MMSFARTSMPRQHGVLFCSAVAVLASALLWGSGANAEGEAIKSHGYSFYGDLTYPADYPHFNYVNPDAPKGGTIATMGTLALQTFDSFNGYILKGDPAQGLALHR